jgi:hypothetical protein
VPIQPESILPNITGTYPFDGLFSPELFNLLYSSREEKYNNAVALREFLMEMRN